MNRTLALLLAVGLASSTVAIAQAPAAPAADIKPEAVPAKVAVIAFEQGVVATNEGQTALANIQKKFEPKKAAIDALAAEVDSLKKQVQSLPANTTDEERASRLKVIDTKEKQLNFDAEGAQTAYQSDLQEAYGKVAQKFGAAAVKYAQDNGFNLLLNSGGNQQAPNNLLWFDVSKMDVTQAVVNAYNVSSGVTAPAPSAPSAVHHTAPHPAATTAPKK